MFFVLITQVEELAKIIAKLWSNASGRINKYLHIREYLKTLRSSVSKKCSQQISKRSLSKIEC